MGTIKQRRRGRPPSPKSEQAALRKNGHPLQIWFTRDEWAELRSTAEASGETLAAYVRRRCGFKEAS
jgi:hypothetical protein